MITYQQIRAARAMAGLTQAELAKLAGISTTGMNNIERGQADAKGSTLRAIQAALDAAGIEFLAEDNGGPGVRIRKYAKGAEEISRQIDALEDKISSMPAPTEPSPEAGMNIMRKAVAKNDLAKLKNRRKRIRSDRSK
jgi:transcriptional regulator with XRE-family HTH domain